MLPLRSGWLALLFIGSIVQAQEKPQVQVQWYREKSASTLQCFYQVKNIHWRPILEVQVRHFSVPPLNVTVDTQSGAWKVPSQAPAGWMETSLKDKDRPTRFFGWIAESSAYAIKRGHSQTFSVTLPNQPNAICGTSEWTVIDGRQRTLSGVPETLSE